MFFPILFRLSWQGKCSNISSMKLKASALAFSIQNLSQETLSHFAVINFLWTQLMSHNCSLGPKLKKNVCTLFLVCESACECVWVYESVLDCVWEWDFASVWECLVSVWECLVSVWECIRVYVCECVCICVWVRVSACEPFLDIVKEKMKNDLTRLNNQKVLKQTHSIE